MLGSVVELKAPHDVVCLALGCTGRKALDTFSALLCRCLFSCFWVLNGVTLHGLDIQMYRCVLPSGQERFGTVICSYYRGAHGIILVYDVTRRETFTNLVGIWAKEVGHYSTNHDCIKILIGNKVDKESERAVSKEEGMALAKEHRCLFLECSAKTRENVQQCFEDLTLKILEVPSLREKGSVEVKRQKQKRIYETSQRGGCCS
ncbi:ras-related protein RABC2a-like [Trifolium pratense]|uniref:Ras-related protein RABC2a-like n=1 Tax=Trifolium pratense TaxID=57577 RepID=A0A2K3MVD0_TRIPR|nr:ras-related protein RABC2a-like [Trifolium pratense]